MCGHGIMAITSAFQDTLWLETPIKSTPHGSEVVVKLIFSSCGSEEVVKTKPRPS